MNPSSESTVTNDSAGQKPWCFLKKKQRRAVLAASGWKLAEESPPMRLMDEYLAKPIEVTVHHFLKKDLKYTVTTNTLATVKQLKKLIWKKGSVPVWQQRLSIRKIGRLDNKKSLDHYGIKEDTRITCSPILVSGGYRLATPTNRFDDNGQRIFEVRTVKRKGPKGSERMRRRYNRMKQQRVQPEQDDGHENDD